MAEPSTKFEDLTPNFTLKGNPEENISDLVVHRSMNAFVSCWELSDAEREQIAKTGKIYLSVIGGMHPPVAVSAFPLDVVPNPEAFMKGAEA